MSDYGGQVRLTDAASASLQIRAFLDILSRNNPQHTP